MLDADPSIDWSKVDPARLRQHLIDMNQVVLRSKVKQSAVPGTGRTEQAIRAMLIPHAVELDRMPEFVATTELIRDGVRLTLTAKGPGQAVDQFQ